MLSLYKRKDIWHIRGHVTDGQRVVKVRRTTGQTSKRQAELTAKYVEETILNDMRGGTVMLPFTSVADDWASVKPLGATDKVNLDRLKTFFADYQINRIKKQDWNAFVASQLYGAKPSHINRVRATLVSILSHADIQPEFKRVKEANDRVRILTKMQRMNLLEAYPAYIQPMFYTIAYQGLRLSEAHNLRMSHINPETKQMLIEKTKNGKRRIIPIHPKVQSRLFPLLDRTNAYLFFNHAGERYADPRNLRGVHQRACAKAGVFDFTIHDWRHDWASQLMMNGANIKDLMKLGGWSSERMVLRYASTTDEHTANTLMGLE